MNKTVESTQAKNRIVAPKASRELHTGTMDTEGIPDIILPQLNEPLIREAESIAALELGDRNETFELMRFMEDVVEIRLEPSGEENAPMQIYTAVNGVECWVPVGVQAKIKRMFLETLVRAKPIKVNTSHETPEQAQGRDPINRVSRSARSLYPLSVIHDPAGAKGAAWLSKLMAER